MNSERNSERIERHLEIMKGICPYAQGCLGMTTPDGELNCYWLNELIESLIKGNQLIIEHREPDLF